MRNFILNFVFDCKQAIPYVSYNLKIGAGQLGSVAEIAPKSAAVTFVQKPYPVWSSAGAKLSGVNTVSVRKSLTLKGNLCGHVVF